MGRLIKKTLDDLAIFGGEPLFKNHLHVGRPNIGDKKLFFKMINDILNRKWLTNDGKYVKIFEEKICEILGVKHCVATCNGTMALQLAIRALELSEEVIVPSFTFIATPNALLWQGIKPVFCDIEKDYNIDLKKVESLINEKTSGIIAVHIWGRPCDIDGLYKIKNYYGLKLIFDSSHAFFCSYKNKMIGSFNDVEIFSFHATKFINSIEGGIVVTNNDDIAYRIKIMRNFGFVDYDRTAVLGINGKMNEICAAMGLVNLYSIEKFIEINKNNYLEYKKNLDGIKGISIIEYDIKEKCNYQYIVIEIDEDVTNISRDNILRILHAERILARRYFYPGCHRMEPYKSIYSEIKDSLQKTEELSEKVLCLPTGTEITKKEISIICDLLNFIVENGAEISKRMD